MNSVVPRIAKSMRLISEGSKEFRMFGKGAFSDFLQICENIRWLSESFSSGMRIQRFNEMRKALSSARLSKFQVMSAVFWESIRRGSIAFVGGIHALSFLLRGSKMELTWAFWFPLPVLVIDWQGSKRSLEEQIALSQWFLSRRHWIFAYRLTEEYRPGWKHGEDGRYRQVSLSHIELAELHMLKAIAAFNSRNYPLHFVFQMAKKSRESAVRWSFDENNQDSLSRFVAVQMTLGDLLFHVAERWPDETAQTAPFLNKSGQHILDLGTTCLRDALECALGNDAHQEPKVRKIMQRHGLLEAA